jgi:hypothetical protein
LSLRLNAIVGLAALTRRTGRDDAGAAARADIPFRVDELARLKS